MIIIINNILTMPNYGDPKYWEERYEEQMGTTFDWLEDYETLRPIIEELKIEKSIKILNLGCGNSEFCERMYDEGYHNLFNIDICQNVIKFMQDRNIHREKMICMNFILKFFKLKPWMQEIYSTKIIFSI
jgi:hypothetical protein